MNYPPPPQRPGANYPPPGGNPPGPPGGYPPQPGGYPPQQGYLPPEYGGQGPIPPPPDAPQRRRGCGGCWLGCLIAFLASIAAVGVVIVAVVIMVKASFPDDLSFGDAAGCMVMRVIVDNGDTIIDQTDGSAADKAELRRGLDELRAEYERECVASNIY